MFGRSIAKLPQPFAYGWQQCPPLLLAALTNGNTSHSSNASSTSSTTATTSRGAAFLDILSSCYKQQQHYHNEPVVAANNHASSTQQLLSISAIVFALGTVAATLLWTLRRRQQQHPKGRRRSSLRRSVSFTSSMLAAKTIPKQVNLPDPVINAVILFEPGKCPTTQDVLELVVSKMLDYERLSLIPVLGKNGHLTFQSGSYDPSQLIRRLQINGDDSSLYKTIQDHIHDALDDPNERGSLPWWEFLIVENKGRGHSACVWRIHHALGDGISLATVAEHILQFADGSPMTSVVPQGMLERRGNKHHSQQVSWYTLAWKLWMANWQVMSIPFSKPDHPTVFSSTPLDMVHTRRREAVLFPNLPLEFIKAIKNAAHVSINDVLFTCLSQAICDYLQEQDCPVWKEQQKDLLCRALIAAVLPRSVHDATTETLQNKWFLLSSDLGVGSASSSASPQHDNNNNNATDIMDRLQYLHKHMQALKTSPVPIVGLAHQNYFMPYIPRKINEWVTYNTFVRRSLTISNVPGPAKTCLFANQPAVGVHMFMSNIIPHVAFISYAGQIFGNITLDPVAIPEPRSLSNHFRRAVVTLAERLDVPVPESLKK